MGTWFLRAFGLACGLLAAAAGRAQDAGGPRLVLSQDSWDFGAVWVEERPTLTLTVRNEGTAELRLTDVRSTCGCTVAQPTRRVVPPGESTDIQVTFDTTGKQGAVTSQVIVESNDARRPKVEFSIKGQVKRAVTRTPLGGLVIRSLDPRPGQTGVVRLENQMPQPMTPTLRGHTLPMLDVELREVTPGLVYDVVGRTNATVPVGTVRGAVLLATGLEREPTLTIPARVEIVGRVELVPPAIYIRPGERTAQQRVVRIQYYGEGEFKVLKAHPPGDAVRITVGPVQPPAAWQKRLTPAPTAVAEARVQLPPAAELPGDRVVVTLETSDPQAGPVELLVTTDKQAFQEKMYGRAAPGTAAPVDDAEAAGESRP